jgi:2-polyprenyl-3-methyl-5-hydroxy-6-metoxy-1,4-benzoquinol methylase
MQRSSGFSKEMMMDSKYEAAVKACYSTWGDYYEEYYGANAAYPPVHSDIIFRILKEGGVESILDAGCGPASLLRDLAPLGAGLYGFDLTPELVAEGKRVFTGLGLPSTHIWEGSVTEAASYKQPVENQEGYDAVICSGVFPHIPETLEDSVITNMHNAARAGGLVIVEARNQLFSLFTLNRYSYTFFLEELIRAENLTNTAGANRDDIATALEMLKERFRMDLPPLRTGDTASPGYDEVLSRTHNPFVLKERFVKAGFTDTRLLFYHYHCLPPMFESYIPDLFRACSLAIEDPEDWRGHFMASAFLLVGKSG